MVRPCGLGVLVSTLLGRKRASSAESCRLAGPPRCRVSLARPYDRAALQAENGRYLAQSTHGGLGRPCRARTRRTDPSSTPQRGSTDRRSRRPVPRRVETVRRGVEPAAVASHGRRPACVPSGRCAHVLPTCPPRQAATVPKYPARFPTTGILQRGCWVARPREEGPPTPRTGAGRAWPSGSWGLSRRGRCTLALSAYRHHRIRHGFLPRGSFRGGCWVARAREGSPWAPATWPARDRRWDLGGSRVVVVARWHCRCIAAGASDTVFYDDSIAAHNGPVA